MLALRKKKEDITDEEKDLLACLFFYSPQLKVAYDVCNALTEIFDKSMIKRRAKSTLKNWMNLVKERT